MSIAHQCPTWVKSGNARPEYLTSALVPIPDLIVVASTCPLCANNRHGHSSVMLPPPRPRHAVLDSGLPLRNMNRLARSLDPNQIGSVVIGSTIERRWKELKLGAAGLRVPSQAATPPHRPAPR